MIEGASSLSILLATAIVGETLFTAIVAAGVIGTMIVSGIIITYTVYEFRRKEIW